MIGHSYGGYTALAAGGAQIDTGGFEALSYEHASSAMKARIALTDAEHMIFTGPCEATPLLLRLVSGEFCSDPGWDRQYAHDLIRHFTTAFLLHTLKGDPVAHKALLPKAVQFAGIEYTTTQK